jgi:hypothetical protein
MKRILLLFFALGFIICLAQAQTTPKIYSRWSGRVLICNNDLSEYSAYQWYKSDTQTGPFALIPGATNQYYAQESGFDGYFYVQATIKSTGAKINSDILSIHTLPATKVSVFPNPAVKSSAINIETTSPDIQLAKIQIFTMSGILVRQYTTNDASAAIESPSATGCYTVRIQLQDGSTTMQKLFVK